jgi:3-deoxy-D-manno-octulosonate 8-phosphate phosphatase KdsC-like HAD superfamily phosphatase
LGPSNSSSDSCVFSGIDVVVFDLDGTLLDSEKLVDGRRRRTPYDLLKFTGDSDESTPLKKWKDVQKHLSYLIQCGIKVAVITESPKAYASTACFLLGIDFHILMPNNTDPSLNTKSKKLDFLLGGVKPNQDSSDKSETWNPGSKVLYVGDTRDDLFVARELSIYYQDIHEFLNSKSSNLKRFLRHMVDVIEAEPRESCLKAAGTQIIIQSEDSIKGLLCNTSLSMRRRFTTSRTSLTSLWAFPLNVSSFMSLESPNHI